MSNSFATLEWLIPNELVVNALPTADTYPQLWQMGVRCILTLCDESEGCLPPIPASFPFLWQRIFLPDSHYAEAINPQALAQVVQTLQHWTQQKLPVYVHCLAGIERSPLACIAYLCTQHHFELWEALNLVQQKHPRTAIRSSQLQALRAYLKQVQA